MNSDSNQTTVIGIYESFQFWTGKYVKILWSQGPFSLPPTKAWHGFARAPPSITATKHVSTKDLMAGFEKKRITTWSNKAETVGSRRRICQLGPIRRVMQRSLRRPAALQADQLIAAITVMKSHLLATNNGASEHQGTRRYQVSLTCRILLLHRYHG